MSKKNIGNKSDGNLKTIIDFAEVLGGEYGLKPDDTKNLLYEFIELIKMQIYEGHTVRLNGLCSFTPHKYKGKRKEAKFAKEYNYEELRIKAVISRAFKNELKKYGTEFIGDIKG